MRFLLDTAVLVFATGAPERLSKRAASTLKDPENILEVSTVSLAEIAIKVSIGKLDLPSATVRGTLQDLSIRALPYSTEHAFGLLTLPWHHKDPFDRLIIAVALVEDVAVITSDDKFKSYKGLRIIW
jgi:PIN domain nuclease of toxin-antitoxin system